MKRRIFALLLAILMVVSNIPVSVFATGDADAEMIPTETETESTTEPACPTCGLNGCESGHLTWCPLCKIDDCGIDHVMAIDEVVPEESSEPTDPTDPTDPVCETCKTSPCTCPEVTEVLLIGFLDKSTHDSFTFHGFNDPKTVEAASAPDFLILKQKTVKKSLTQDEAGNTQLVETVWYQVDSTDNEFWSNVIVSYPDTEATNFKTIVSAEGLYTAFDGKEVTLYKEAANDSGEKAVLSGEYVIEEFVYSSTASFWFAKLIPDSSWPADAVDCLWISASDIVKLSQTPTQPQPQKCPVCGEPGCTTDHIKCEICGDYDCAKLHFYCDKCQSCTCTTAHLICRACGAVDCEETHTFCGSCGEFDCTDVHEVISAPATSPVIPSNPTMTPGADISIVDAAGNAVTGSGFTLTAGTKASLSAWAEGDDNGDYQWQIGIGDLWVNIQGQTGKGILLSPAMVLPAKEVGAVSVRCVMTRGEETLISEAIPVSVAQQKTAGSSAGSSDDGALPVADDNENKVNLIVNFVFTDGKIAANPWSASLPKGQAYATATPITVPIVAGYSAKLGENAVNDRVTLDPTNNQMTLNLTADDLSSDCTINIVYHPAQVKVVVNHYWQNVDNDNYTLHETEETTALTDSQLGNAHKTYEGFYNLLYEHPYVAADGSTVVDVYYDRYYYLMTFDLGGGYGMEAIYARYGTPIEDPGEPVRPGYTLRHWTLDGNVTRIPATMPARHSTYVAVWAMADTAKLTVMIWGENPDDEKYSVVSTKELNVKTGATVKYENGYVCGGDASHTHTSDCQVVMDNKIWTYEKTDTVTVNADGSSVLNVYFTRKEYTLKFYYAASNNQYSINTGKDITYYVIGGSTYYFGGLASVRDKTNEIALLDQYMTNTASKERGEVDKLPTLKSNPGYTLGTSTSNSSGYTYYYISFTAKYGANIYDLWPADVFDSVNCYHPSWKESPTASVSAWNGEHNVYYTQHNENQTIKGKYATLDDNLLWDNAQFGVYADDEDDDGVGESVAFLCFWENGAGVGWSIPELYRYMIFAEAYEGMDTDGLEKFSDQFETDKYPYDKEYYLIDTYDTVDDSDVAHQTYPEIPGLVQVEEYKNNFKFKKLNPDTDFDAGQYNEGYEVYFIYDRETYDLNFFNGIGLIEDKYAEVMWQTPLAEYDFTPDIPIGEDGNLLYEEGSYEFAGWYDNQAFVGEPFNFDSSSMPTGNLTLYAKWVPVTRTVRFFLDAKSMEDGKQIPDYMQELYAAVMGEEDPNAPYAKFAPRTVPNNSFLEDLDDPGVADGYNTIHPYAGYTFEGWFYREDGEEKAFTPNYMPVVKDMDLYGKWGADILCPYIVYYALDADGNGEADVDGDGNIIYVAKPETGSARAGNSRTFDAKGDTALYSDYREGYFPNVASHTIELKVMDKDGIEGQDNTTFTFLYTPGESVPYTVRYVDKTTGEAVEVDGEPVEDKVVADNKKAVVTENFKVIPGYMPDAYQKILVVTPNGENIITFYYTKDTVHAPVQVIHYTQNVGGGYTVYQEATDLNTVIGADYTAGVLDIIGFNFVKATANGTEVFAVDKKVTAKVSADGLLLELYYDRQAFTYQVQYLEYGTNKVLHDPKTGNAVYGQVVYENAETIEIDLDGDGKNEDFKLYDATQNPLSAEIRDNTTVLTFYYVRCTQNLSVTKTLIDEGNEHDENLEFNFVLTIHANDFHKTSYQYEIGDESGYLEVADDGEHWPTLSFSLKAGETIVIKDLPTAQYTVAEQALPLGYYTNDSTQTVTLTDDEEKTVTVTNTYAPAKLKIAKIVDHVEQVDDKVKDFEFYITVPEGITGTYSYMLGDQEKTVDVMDGVMTITLQDQQTALFTNLPVGTYTVAEKDYTHEGYSATYEDSDGTATDGKVELKAGETDTVTCTNKYPVGSLTITKTVEKEYENDTFPGATFEFTVIRTDTVVPLVAGDTYPIYSGTEKIDDAVVEEKTIDGASQNVIVVEISFTELGTKSIKIDHLPQGNYTVVETANADYTQNKAEIQTSISPEDYAGTVEFTNTYQKHLGDLTITKKVGKVGDAEIPADAEFAFTVSGAALTKPTYQVTIGTLTKEVGVTDGSLSLTLKGNETAVIKDLALDAYKVTETQSDSRFIQTAVTGAEGAITSDNVTTAEFTNTYVPRGALKVSKFIDRDVYDHVEIDEQKEFTFTVKLNYPLDRAEEYSATVYTPDADSVTSTLTLVDKNLRFTLKHGQSILIGGLPAVGYTITEAEEDGYLVPNFEGNDTGTIPSEDTKEVTCYNPVALANGSLSIQKNVVDTTANHTAPKGQAFEFKVKLRNVRGTPGQTYDVTYDCDPAKGTVENKDGVWYYTPAGGNAIEPAGTVRLEGAVYPEEYEPEPGDDMVYPDGGAIAPEEDPLLIGEYRFTLTLYDGLTATIKDLPPSAYYVEELDYGAEGFTTTYTGQSGFIGGVMVDGEAPHAEVTCTNTYADMHNGVLNITKQVTKDYERDVVPADRFRFVITPADENAFAADRSYTVKISGANDLNQVEDTLTVVPEKIDGQEKLALVVEIPFTDEELRDMGRNDSRSKLLTIEGLALGQYRIVEDSDEDYQQNRTETTVTVGSNPGSAVFINRYRRHLGTLTITKNLAEGTADDGQLFLFHITGNGISMDVTVKAGESITVYDLPLGTYTVTEDASWSWRYTQTGSDLSDNEITLDDLYAKVSFTNARSNPKWLTFFDKVLNSFVAKTTTE